jgi:hypothetical protein|tara:strand:- start:820 stop:1347 length:528 start_codon:yes stop_codon:yes gene_type:complete
MGRQYPIWNVIDNDSYATDKSYGVRDTATTFVKVGTSSRNSHDFVSTEITTEKDKNGDRIFRFFVDGVLIKKATVKNGKIYHDEDVINKENSISIKWCISDIENAMNCREDKIDISKKECMDILLTMERRHDASLGINWDGIDYYLDEFIQDKLTKLGHKIKNYGMEEYEESEVK